MGVYKKEPIKDFEDYQIDTNGVVYNKNGTIKKVRKRKDSGYLDTVLIDKNKKKHCKRINRLVAIQFIPNPDNLPEVNHKDGNKTNNNIDNLEWCTSKYNSEHSIKILKHGNMKKIIGIDIDTNEIIYRFDSLADAGRFFSNGKNYRPYQNSICKVLKGLRRTYKNCYWKYST